jgi:hypothetical protein
MRTEARQSNGIGRGQTEGGACTRMRRFFVLWGKRSSHPKAIAFSYFFLRIGGRMFPCVARDVPYFPCLEVGHLFFLQFFEDQTDLDQISSGVRQNNRLHAIIGLRNTVGEKPISDGHLYKPHFQKSEWN